MCNGGFHVTNPTTLEILWVFTKAASPSRSLEEIIILVQDSGWPGLTAGDHRFGRHKKVANVQLAVPLLLLVTLGLHVVQAQLVVLVKVPGVPGHGGG